MAQFCRGGGGGCDCEQFTPTADNPARCLECEHGLSKHPNTGAAASSNPTPSNNVPSDATPTPSNGSLQIYGSTNLQNILGNMKSRKPEARKEALSTKTKVGPIASVLCFLN